MLRTIFLVLAAGVLLQGSETNDIATDDDPGVCICDLTQASCDTYCCCDLDCPSVSLT
jgi:hypothetical protein